MKRIGTTLGLVAFLAAACGGGSDGTVAGIDAGGSPDPVATNVVSSGAITGFGSIVVNDVHYDTSNAEIVVDGTVATQDALAVGDVVVIQGTLSDDGTTGTASNVTFDDAVEGPISAIDLAASTLTVLGQLVHVDADTSFDDRISPASLEGLTVGDIVEVTGFLLADGSIGATRIEPKAAGEEFEVTGQVANLDAGALAFTLGGLTVDYSAAQLDDFPAGAPENGQLVEAKGTELGTAGELLATRVEFKGDDRPGAAGDRIEVEGFITRFVSATDFDVEGVPVTTDSGTVYENGSSADLALNHKVEVEGVLDDSGTIVADEVELKQAGFIRIASTVESIGSDRLTVLGIEVRVDTSTRMEDKTDAEVEPFTLANLAVGDFVEVRGFEDEEGVKATLLEREDPDDEVELRGFVESASSPDFVVLGVTIRTDAGTVFRDVNDAVIDGPTFFGQAEGHLVEADGTLANGIITAEEVELED
ncbi:MAG TPA: DUF5666 domain-containing protein [Woeseiaceae bacterium]|nr:DUF5666 domain-containing protein [Woeseiaceae bacterium]